MLDDRELGAYLRHATRSLFRLETLPAYDVPTDRGDLRRRWPVRRRHLGRPGRAGLVSSGARRCLARGRAVRWMVESTPGVPPCRLIPAML